MEQRLFYLQHNSPLRSVTIRIPGELYDEINTEVAGVSVNHRMNLLLTEVMKSRRAASGAANVHHSGNQLMNPNC